MDRILTAYMALATAALAAYAWHILSWHSRSRGRPLPPGPKSLPILGNLFNFPTVRQWIANLELASIYGGRGSGSMVWSPAPFLISGFAGNIVHFRVLGQSIIVLNSADDVVELLEKRSATSSDRPQTPMIEL